MIRDLKPPFEELLGFWVTSARGTRVSDRSRYFIILYYFFRALLEDVSKASGVICCLNHCWGCRPKFCTVHSARDGSILNRNSSVLCSKRHERKQIVPFNLLYIFFSLTNKLLWKRNVFILKSSSQLVFALNANSGCSEATYLRRYHQQHKAAGKGAKSLPAARVSFQILGRRR